MSSADRWAPFDRFASRPRTWLLPYGWALLAVVAAALLRYSLNVALGFTLPFLFFYPAIMLISLLGGLGPSLLATAASAALAWYYLLERAIRLPY